MNAKIIIAAVAALFPLSGSAQADTLINYTFSPGSYFNLSDTNTYAALGGFTFNATTNTISNVTYSAAGIGSGSFGTFNFTSGTVDSPTQLTFSGDGHGDFDTFVFAQSLALGGTDAITGGFYSTSDTRLAVSAGGSVTSLVKGAVPEPATWAMMLLGFGAIGFAMRRRSQPENYSLTS